MGDTAQGRQPYSSPKVVETLRNTAAGRFDDLLFPAMLLWPKLWLLAWAGKSEQILKTESWQERVRVGKSHLGRGVYARRLLRKGQVVGEIRGKVIDDPHHSTAYGIDLGGTRQLEPIAPFRFLNHSCEPNCEIIFWEDENGEHSDGQLWLRTLSTLRLGDELVIDYGWPADAAIECGCGAGSCRGWVVSLEELPKVLQLKKKKPTKKRAKKPVKK